MKTKDITLTLHAKYHSGPAILHLGKYATHENNSLQLRDPIDEGLIMTCSCNPTEKLLDTEIAIKDWSENEGIEYELIRLGIIGPRLRTIPSGHVKISIHTLNMDMFRA